MPDLLGLEVAGRSLGGIQTCLEVPEWRLAVDLGVLPRSAIRLGTVLVTHAHVDHLGCVASHNALRELMGMEPPTYVVPPSVAAPLGRLFEAWRELDGSTFAHRLVPLAPGEVLSLRRDLEVTPFRTVHRVVSQGYVVRSLRKHLREAFRDRSPEELRELRRAGEDLERVETTPELAVSGDTRLEGVLDHEEVRRARRLVLEVTFLDGRVPVERARSQGHVHLDEVVAAADRFENGALLMTHVSQRYGPDEARRRILEALPADLRERTQVLVRPA